MIMPRLHLHRSSYDFSVCDFLTILDIGSDVCVNNSTISCSGFRQCFESEPYGYRMEIVGYLHSLIGNRTEPVRRPRGVAMISD